MAAFVSRVHLRWNDLDAYGHCNNAAFITYLEQARVEVFHSHATDTSGVELLNQGVVVVEHRIRYRRQVSYSPIPLRVVLWTAQLRAASYTAAYEVWNDSSGTPELAATGRPRRLSPAERAFLEQFRPEPQGDELRAETEAPD